MTATVIDLSDQFALKQAYNSIQRLMDHTDAARKRVDALLKRFDEPESPYVSLPADVEPKEGAG